MTATLTAAEVGMTVESARAMPDSRTPIPAGTRKPITEATYPTEKVATTTQARSCGTSVAAAARARMPRPATAKPAAYAAT